MLFLSVPPSTGRIASDSLYPSPLWPPIHQLQRSLSFKISPTLPFSCSVPIPTLMILPHRCPETVRSGAEMLETLLASSDVSPLQMLCPRVHISFSLCTKASFLVRRWRVVRISRIYWVVRFKHVCFKSFTGHLDSQMQLVQLVQ